MAFDPAIQKLALFTRDLAARKWELPPGTFPHELSVEQWSLPDGPHFELGHDGDPEPKTPKVLRFFAERLRSA